MTHDTAPDKPDLRTNLELLKQWRVYLDGCLEEVCDLLEKAAKEVDDAKR